jgi:hypothetical protein
MHTTFVSSFIQPRHPSSPFATAAITPPTTRSRRSRNTRRSTHQHRTPIRLPGHPHVTTMGPSWDDYVTPMCARGDRGKRHPPNPSSADQVPREVNTGAVFDHEPLVQESQHHQLQPPSLARITFWFKRSTHHLCRRTKVGERRGQCQCRHQLQHWDQLRIQHQCRHQCRRWD